MQKIKVILLGLVSITFCYGIFIVLKIYFDGYFFGYKHTSFKNAESLSSIMDISSVMEIDEILANGYSDSLFLLTCRENKKLVVWKFNSYNNISLSDIYLSDDQMDQINHVSYDNSVVPKAQIAVLTITKTSEVRNLHLKFLTSEPLNCKKDTEFIFGDFSNFAGFQLGDENKELIATAVCFLPKNYANVVVFRRSNSLYIIMLLSDKLLDHELLNLISK